MNDGDEEDQFLNNINMPITINSFIMKVYFIGKNKFLLLLFIVEIKSPQK